MFFNATGASAPTRPKWEKQPEYGTRRKTRTDVFAVITHQGLGTLSDNSHIDESDAFADWNRQ
jgi:hypothetical protein